MLINITGSFALGLLTGTAGTSLGPTGIAILGTGLLGGYTTFSTASVDTAHLWSGKGRRLSLFYAGGTGVLAIAAAGVGYAL